MEHKCLPTYMKPIALGNDVLIAAISDMAIKHKKAYAVRVHLLRPSHTWVKTDSRSLTTKKGADHQRPSAMKWVAITYIL